MNGAEDSGSERMVFRFGVPIPTTTTSVTITSSFGDTKQKLL